MHNFFKKILKKSVQKLFINCAKKFIKNFIYFLEIRSKVNEQITNQSYGRLFAIIAFDNHQYKLTEGDLLMVLLNIGAKNGQKIRLDKICLIGSKDFTLLGRPLLPRDLVNVEATVVEKSLSHKKIVQMLRSNSPNHKITGRRPIRWQECE